MSGWETMTMSEAYYYAGDADDLDGMTKDQVMACSWNDYDYALDAFEEVLNDSYPEVEVVGCLFDSGSLLRVADPIAFRVAASEYISEIDLNDYPDEDDYDEEEDE